MKMTTDFRHLLQGVSQPRTMNQGRMQNPCEHSSAVIGKNRIIAEVFGPDGVKKQRIDHTGNIMATYGLNRLAAMGATDAGGASAYANDMAIGTDSTAAASTQTGLLASTQLVSGANFVRTLIGARTLQWNATFASDGNASAVHEVGVFQTNDATASMIARSVLGTDSINRGTADEIRMTYQAIFGTA